MDVYVPKSICIVLFYKSAQQVQCISTYVISISGNVLYGGSKQTHIYYPFNCMKRTLTFYWKKLENDIKGTHLKKAYITMQFESKLEIKFQILEMYLNLHI